MKARCNPFALCGLSFAFLVVSAAANAWGQSSDVAPAFALAGAMLFVVLSFVFAGYVYMALAFQTIANKTNTPNAWLAWIPIANFFLLLAVAKKPAWWFLLLLIPVVNIVIAVIVWMAVATARGKPDWWGILVIVPLVNIVVPGYLAWAD